MRSFGTYLVPICFLGNTSFADEVPKIDERGAVLCSYAITATMEAIRSECRPDSERLAKALNYSLNQHREFVLRNSESTEADLVKFESDQGSMHGASCDEITVEGWMRMLDLIEQDPRDFENRTDHLLSVDREPVWNPCL